MFRKPSPLRRLPYPYRAALSISDDPDFQSFAFFDEFYKFLNTTDKTAFGIGLGLEAAGGLFFHTQNPYHFSYFKTGSFADRTNDAPRIDEYLKTGRIDTNHAHGDFDHKGGFTRAHAQANADALAKLNVGLPVFTNHGDVHNIQNIGRNYPGYRGDDRTASEYHADLLPDMGCEFVWSQDLVDDNGTLSEPLFDDEPLKELSPLKGFRRLRGTGYHAPNLSSFAYQLSLLDFEDLYESNAAVILYQHLGILVRHARLCVPATIENVCATPHVLAGFYRLADEARKGDLWVAATGRLLRYRAMVDAATITETSYNTFTVDAPDGAHFDGLTIYANTQDPVHVYHRGKELPLCYNGPDETGRYSVTVPMIRMENIW